MQHSGVAAQHAQWPAQHADAASLRTTFDRVVDVPVHVVQTPQMVVVGYRYRIRWENVVPTAAVLLFVVAGVMAATSIGNWDSGARQRTDAPAADQAPAIADSARSIDAATIATRLAAARTRANAGDFLAAESRVHAMRSYQAEHPQIARLHDELHARKERYDSALTRFGRHLHRRDLAAARADLVQVRTAAPASPELAVRERQLRQLARASRAAKATAPAPRPPAGNVPPRPERAIAPAGADTRAHPGSTSRAEAPPVATDGPVDVPPAPPIAGAVAAN